MSGSMAPLGPHTRPRAALVGLLATVLAAGAAVAVVRWLERRKKRTSRLRVHMHLAKVGVTEEHMQLFRSLLHECVDFSHGPEVPDEVEVLISNMPSEQMFRVRALRSVILPYAGPPPVVVKKIRDDHPHLTLHNLHSNAISTAEMGMGLLLAAAKLIVPADRQLREGDWRSGGGLALSAADINVTPMHQVILEGKTALILGLGEVGSRIATACLALGMKVRGVRRSVTGPPRQRQDGVWVYPPTALRELLPDTTALFVCMPSTPETRGLVGQAELGLLPREAIVVNMGRGDIVDEQALYDALLSKQIHGAGLDVWWQYPSKDSPIDQRQHPSRFDFASLENVVMSPHRGGAPGLKESEERRIRALSEMINEAVKGGGLHALPNRVPLHRGY